ncbi:hypothetical protein RFI_35699 [Reticulomyxa filosa]|uniref:Uncharacterized protein n=1 Tax=Reticulomyxa filosa TaxID=46433 RepID=X6LK46_RETFI|nr:hypothetical protein RFI_35699 [Reticulomyxa filosa]|eukprot:ETO01741.1 hypothetical protein RFI_35699 [Reticulomyxa filosa]
MDWKLEMSILFPNVRSEAKNKMQENQKKEIENAGGLQKTKHCWQILKLATEIIQNAHKNKKNFKSDEKWQTFLKQFEVIGQLERDKEQTSIKEASNCYCICMECFGDITKSKSVLELIAENENKIGEFATKEIFTNKEQFGYAIQKMDDSLNENFRHLVGKLRTVNRVLQTKIWNRTYVLMSELAKAVIELYKEKKLKGCLNMDFDEFFRFIKEGDQLPVIKDYEQLLQANKMGKWVLDGYETLFGIQSLTTAANLFETRKLKIDKCEGLTLQFLKTKRDCEELENTFDRLKLGLTSKQKKDIETIILQFETCKDIYALRMDYWEKGGRDEIGKLILPAKNTAEDFENCKKEWTNKLNKWKKEGVELRYNYPCLAYFTMNEAQHLIAMMNQILIFENQYWDDLASKYILPYFQRLDYSLQNTSETLSEWKEILDKKSVRSLGEVVSKIWKNSRNNKRAPNQITSLHQGKPNLIILATNNKGFATILNLYKSIGMLPRAEHVLICKKTTTEEEIECLLLRALLCTRQFEKDSAQASLYCLVWPEKLAKKTQAKVVKLLQRMLLQHSELQRMKQYLFAVVSSNMDNDVAGVLKLFQLEFTFGESIHSFDVEEELYTKQLNSFLRDKSNRKPFVQLYASNNIGMGKTWKIQADIEKYQKECKIEKIYVRFNSSVIDWKWTMNTLWQYHPCKFDYTLEDNMNSIQKNKDQIAPPEDTLVIYHLDISSCVNRDINDFLFQLLYLQHIDTDCSIFHVSSNMAFFIEIPSQFDSSEGTARDILYTLFPKSNFPIVTVNEFNNPFQLSSNTPDINPDNIENLSNAEITDFMESSFESIWPCPLNYTIFFKFLFTQFKILANSRYLTNRQVYNHHIQYKQETTKCVTAIAKELFANMFIKEEEMQFCLCRKLQRSESLYLINHDGIEI